MERYKSKFKEAKTSAIPKLFNVFKQVKPKSIMISTSDEEGEEFKKKFNKDLDKIITDSKVTIPGLSDGKNLPINKFKLVDSSEWPDYASPKDFTFIYYRSGHSLDDAIWLWFPKK